VEIEVVADEEAGKVIMLSEALRAEFGYGL
jgi:hypothetical protein